MAISTNPPKGTADWYPEEFRIRQYIFSTRRQVCEQFGYDEYLGPLVEESALWEAKSGEDVGGTELTKLTKKDGTIGTLALRPEMTPTVTRMVTKYGRQYTKPLRRFSIANFYRNERPQRGRNREFWQCNVDIFGTDSLQAELEILSMAIETMLAFGATAEQFELRVNHRKLVDAILDGIGIDAELKSDCIRTMDKFDKLDSQVFLETLQKKGCTLDQSNLIKLFMKASNLQKFEDSFAQFWEGNADSPYEQLKTLLSSLENLGYGEYIIFCPSLMRGFDYYDGVVFEVFDKHPDNNRAMFGGGRYNGLADVFGSKTPIPAMGFAPGDEPAKLFLESRGLLPDDHSLLKDTWFIPFTQIGSERAIQHKAKELRLEGKRVEVGIKLIKNKSKVFEYAEKKGIPKERVVFVNS